MEQIHAVYDYLQSFNVVSILLRLLLAVVAGGVIGTERGRHGSPAGFRTHILVCLGGTMTSLCSLYVRTAFPELGGDVFRISASVISGIGFLGAGIILVKNNSTISGLTTAAGMWVTAAIGVAFGYGFYLGAVVGTILCVVNAAVLTKIEHRRKQALHFYFEVNDISKIQTVLSEVGEILQKDMIFETTQAKSGIPGHVGFNVTTSYKHSYENIEHMLVKIDGISFVVQG